MSAIGGKADGSTAQRTMTLRCLIRRPNSKRNGSATSAFHRLRGEACGTSVSRLAGTFCGVNVAIDYLEVWQAPIGEQIRPRRFPVFAPHPKQRDAVVNFGALPQPSAALAAAPRLQPPQEPGVVTRRVPKLPRDHTGAVPVRIHVDAAIPQIDMPTEAIGRSAAHAAESWTLRICAFAIGRGWRSICGRQSMLAVIAELPSPTSGRSAPRSQRTRQPIGADRMGAECPRQNRGWKDAWQCPIEAGERLTISFCLLRLPFGHLRPPVATSWCHQAVKPSSPKGNRLYAPAT
jgi:hypothetical protein